MRTAGDYLRQCRAEQKPAPPFDEKFIQELPVEGRVEVLNARFYEEITRLMSQGDLEGLRSLELRLRQVFETLKLSPTFLSSSVRNAFQLLFTYQRYSFPFEYHERQEILTRIQGLTGISDKKQCSVQEARTRVIQGLQAISFTGTGHFEIGSYLREVLPEVLTEANQTDVLIALNTAISRCARSGKNDAFPEHIEAFEAVGFNITVSEQMRFEWIQQRVSEVGLLFDPQEAARELGLPADRVYDGPLYNYHAVRREPGEENGESPEQHELHDLADEVVVAVRTIGWGAALALLEDPKWKLEHRLRILNTLIRSYSLSFEVYRDKTLGSLVSRVSHPDPEGKLPEEKNDGRLVLEMIERLPITAEVKNDFVQEVYAMSLGRNELFLDTITNQWMPPLQLSHPAIRAVRAENTKKYLEKLKSSNFRIREDFERSFFFHSAALPPDEWSPEQRRQFAFYLWTDLAQELERAPHSPEKVDALIQEQLVRFFTDPEGPLYGWAEQSLILYAEKIRLFCKKDPSFHALYERWLAGRVALNFFTLEKAERQPGKQGTPWSEEACEYIVTNGVLNGAWESVHSIVENNPSQRAFLLDKIEQGTRKGILERIVPHSGWGEFQDAQWFLGVFQKYPEAVRSCQIQGDFPWEMYHVLIARFYLKREVPTILSVAPGIDHSHLEIQKALAFCTVKGIRTKKDLVPAQEQAYIEWGRPALREQLVSVIQGELPYLSELKNGSLKAKEQIQSLKELQVTTGYHLSDPLFWSFKGEFIRLIDEELSKWTLLVKEIGSLPGDREKIYAKAQEAVNKICDLSTFRSTECLELYRNHKIAPSESILIKSLIKGLSSAPVLMEILELMKVFGYSYELSLEQIQALKPTSYRAAVLIFTLLLPKQGPERALAEKAFKARTPFSAIVPRLLAIQSPARREEFCPYSQKLNPLFDVLRPDLRDPHVVEGIFLYFNEFGMQNLPNLAGAIIELYQSLQFPDQKKDRKRLLELERLLGKGEETWTIEQYFLKIRSLQAEIRQAILADAPLKSQIEQTALGMELFNAVVPHVGSYQQVTDRPALLSMVRLHKDTLQIDPWYQPASTEVSVVEEESASLEGVGTSSTERAIRSRQDQIEKKYDDETMQRFVSGWQHAASRLLYENSGQSRVYWFSLLQKRWQKQLAELVTKQQTVKNPHGIAALTKQIERLQLGQERLAALISNATHERPSPEELLEELQSLFLNASGKVDRVELEAQAGDVVRVLTLALMRARSPVHYQEVLSAGVEWKPGSKLNPATLEAWETWFREEYLEHFAGLDPEVAVPLSTQTRILLQKLWRIDGLTEKIAARRAGKETGPLTHPLIDPFDTIHALRQEINHLERTARSGKQKTLQFWPVKGIGRVLAGDIANACYHGHREKLARGEEQRLTALLMTLPDSAELAGSTLLIEATTLSGKRVLVIRALNPTEAVIRKSLDAEAVVEATIEYATRVALATKDSAYPIEEVRLCYDHRGGHSTNREEIFAAETALIRKHRWVTGEDLENVTETNFNGYPIYPKEATRVVWRANHP